MSRTTAKRVTWLDSPPINKKPGYYFARNKGHMAEKAFPVECDGKGGASWPDEGEPIETQLEYWPERIPMPTEDGFEEEPSN